MVIGKVVQRMTANGSRIWTIHKNDKVFMKKVRTAHSRDVGGISVITSQQIFRNRITSFSSTLQLHSEAMQKGAGSSDYTSTGKYDACTFSFSNWGAQ